jgi:hypothetical protein
MQKLPKDRIAYTNWDEITVGSLAAQISGIGRECKPYDRRLGYSS